ncbi:MAG: hypothetical protein ACOYN0_15465, partial [Phycisphaerales bacterium]
MGSPGQATSAVSAWKSWTFRVGDARSGAPENDRMIKLFGTSPTGAEDAELRSLLDAWPRLLRAIRKAIAALIAASDEAEVCE